MSLDQRLLAAVQAIGADVKALYAQGTPTNVVPRFMRTPAAATVALGGQRSNTVLQPANVTWEGAANTGIVEIALPLWLYTNTTGVMIKIEISGYSYQLKNSFKAVLGAYFPGSGGAAQNTSGAISGNITARFGIRGGRHCVLIGVDAESNTYSSISVDSMTVFYGGVAEPSQTDLLDFVITANAFVTGSYTSVINADAGLWVGVALNTPWVAYGGAYVGPRYRRNSAGQVELQGMVKLGAAATTIFTLAAGYRPENTLLFVADASAGYARIDIDVSGNVICNSFKSGGTNGYVSLSGICFTPVGRF